MNLSSCLFIYGLLFFSYIGQVYAGSCIFNMREIETSQNTVDAKLNLKLPALPTNKSIDGFISFDRNTKYLIDEASSVTDFFKSVEDAINNGSIKTSYVFTSKKWDDLGLSNLLEGSSSLTYEMKNGRKLYLLKNHQEEVQLYGEVVDEFTGVTEVHIIGNTKFSDHLVNLERRGMVSLSNFDSRHLNQAINIDEFGTPGIVDIVNSYIKAKNQMSNWSFENADRIEIVKSAYRYAIDLKRKGKYDPEIGIEGYVQEAILRANNLKKFPRVSAQNAADLVYESLSMGISADLMARIYRKAYSKISGDRFYYMTFLNSMFGNIKIRNLKGEDIQVTEYNWESVLDEYLSKYKRAVSSAGFFGESKAPMMFAYAMLKSGSYDKNMLYAKEAIKAINKVRSDSKISGAILLLSRGMKIDEDLDQVVALAKKIDRIHSKTKNDKGGAILMGEVATREGLSLEEVKEKTNYLRSTVKTADSETTGEAIYVGQKMGLNFNEVGHAMNELSIRLSTYSSMLSFESLGSQGIVDLLETLRLSEQLESGSYEKMAKISSSLPTVRYEEVRNLFSAFNPVRKSSEETIYRPGQSNDDVDQESILATIDEIVESVADDTMNTVLFLVIVSGAI